MWSWVGVGLSVLGTVIALQNARAPQASVIASDVYGMTSRSHLRFAALSGVFAAAFVAAIVAPRLPALPLLAVYALALVLYATSFARGFSGD